MLFNKMVPFRNGTDGVVAYKFRCGMHCKNNRCERPPRLRRFGGFATFLLMPQPPLLNEEGNIPLPA